MISKNPDAKKMLEEMEEVHIGAVPMVEEGGEAWTGGFERFQPGPHVFRVKKTVDSTEEGLCIRSRRCG